MNDQVQLLNGVTLDEILILLAKQLIATNKVLDDLKIAHKIIAEQEVTISQLKGKDSQNG
jgi:hypothetical protein